MGTSIWYLCERHDYDVKPVVVHGETEKTLKVERQWSSRSPIEIIRVPKATSSQRYFRTRDEAYDSLISSQEGIVSQNRAVLKASEDKLATILRNREVQK